MHNAHLTITRGKGVRLPFGIDVQYSGQVAAIGDDEIRNPWQMCRTRA